MRSLSATISETCFEKFVRTPRPVIHTAIIRTRFTTILTCRNISRPFYQSSCLSTPSNFRRPWIHSQAIQDPSQAFEFSAPFLNANAAARKVFGDHTSKKFNNPTQQKTKRQKDPKVENPLPSENGLNEAALAAVSEFLERKIQPVMLDVELEDDFGEPINLNVRISDTSFQPQYKIRGMARAESDAFTEVVRSQNQDKVLPPCEELQPHILPSERLSLIDALKQIRQSFERRWDSESDAFSEAVVQCLEACERELFLIRNQTTDSIWNVEHQEYRIEVFEESDIGLWYASVSKTPFMASTLTALATCLSKFQK